MPKNDASEREFRREEQSAGSAEEFAGDHAEVQRKVREFNENTDSTAREVADAGSDM